MNFIPESIRMPGSYIEFDNSQAGLGDDMPAVLIYAQKLAAGTAPAGEITQVSSVEDAMVKAGGRSMVADMVRAYRERDEVLDVFILPMADNPAGTAATCPITVNSVATENGTYPLYIDGQYVGVPIETGQTTAQLATAFAAAITAAATTALQNRNNIPCDAAAAASTVTLTALHKGTCGNNIDVRVALYQEKVPAGISITIGGFSGGAGDPVTPDLSVLLEQRYFKYVGLGINNTATYAAWHSEVKSRLQPQNQEYTQLFSAFRGDYAAAYALGETLNYELLSVLSLGINPTSTWRAAAMYAAACAPKLYTSPQESLEGRELTGMVGVNYHTWRDSNSLLFKGMSIMNVAQDGTCTILRPISTYQKRSDGSADDSYLDINTLAILDKTRRLQRNEARKWIGYSAAASAEGFKPGLKIVTKDSVKAMLLSLYKNDLQYEYGLVQNYEFYKSTLQVEQNPTNPSRFDFVDQPVLVSPYYMLAGRNQFRKVAD
jgi:phage tail sheath gpL-like